jgi:phage-related protein (TIGR01555 family)
MGFKFGQGLLDDVTSWQQYVINANARQNALLNEQQVRAKFGPPRTLGASDDVRMAQDEALADMGVYSLITHAFMMGQAAVPQFVGYGVLQGLAQDGLIRACVETVADDLTREWITLTKNGNSRNDNGVEEDGEEDDRLAQLQEAVKRYKLQEVFHKAAELVGYEGGALIFIDTGAPAEELATPLNMSSASAEFRNQERYLRRFTVVDPVNCFPGVYNSLNPLEPDYFEPTTWWVLGQQVHKSRLIRLVANEPPLLLKPAYNFFGIAQAQILWDYVLHFRECRTAAQRLLTKFSMLVFKTDMNDVLYDAKGTQNLDARMMLMNRTRSNDGVWCIDKETEDAVKLETPLGGVTDIVRQSLELIAAINRTPAVKLLGISPSGFNATGESDIRNYYDHVTSQAEKMLRPGITRALDAIQLQLFGDIDKSIDITFNPLGQEDEAALALTQQTRVNTMIAAVQANILSAEEGRRLLTQDPDTGFDVSPDMPEDLQALNDGSGPEGLDLSDLTTPTTESEDVTDAQQPEGVQA